jgi:hypothetical protein
VHALYCVVSCACCWLQVLVTTVNRLRMHRPEVPGHPFGLHVPQSELLRTKFMAVQDAACCSLPPGPSPDVSFHTPLGQKRIPIRVEMLSLSRTADAHRAWTHCHRQHATLAGSKLVCEQLQRHCTAKCCLAMRTMHSPAQAAWLITPCLTMPHELPGVALTCH